MNVLSVGYPLFPVSGDASGGAEQILSYLERQLVREHHKSFVLAAGGSVVSGTLIAMAAPKAVITDEDRTDAHIEYRAALRKLLARGTIDVIHFHGLDFHAYVPQTPVPILATLHLPIAWYPASIFDLPGVTLNCVSRSQAMGRDLPAIPNGIDTEFFRPVAAKEPFLLWLGRICPEKGVHLALQVAHATGTRLILAGPVHPLRAHQEYFEREVKPLLDDKRVHIGPVGREEKRRLLSSARCVLVPSLVEETSSLVSMEAISCGTPVIASRCGALPEVIEDGVTGFVTNSLEEMVTAVSEIGRLSSEKCRKEAVRRFDAVRMARDYMALYARLMQRVGAPA